MHSNSGVRDPTLPAIHEPTMPPEVAWWERFWKGVTLAITVAALFVEGLLPIIRHAAERP